MISHRYKCIFVHIQRTAGTSIENWIVGKDWWRIEKETKHLIASQAKKIYKDYWKDYFKFTFIRNPWDRVVSCLVFSRHFGIKYKSGVLNLDEYKVKYGYPLTIENDYRFSERNELITKKHQKNRVYLNLLDEELDFIGKFESLQKDTDFIKNKLHINKEFQIQNKIAVSTSNLDIIGRSQLLNKYVEIFKTKLHMTREFQIQKKIAEFMSRKENYREYYSAETKKIVEDLYKKDIQTFGYKF